jgi:xylulokinase
MTPAQPPTRTRNRRALLLGVDLGTSSLKLSALDPAGRLVAQASAPVSTIAPREGWHEQDPHGWWRALGQATRELLGREALSGATVVAIGMTGQMHGPVLLDRGGEPLGPCLIWSDSRTAEQVTEVGTAVGRQHLIDVTGSAPNTSFTATKLLWLRRYQPELFARARHVLLPKDYLRYRLTGEICTDVSDASATLLLDVSSRSWAGPLIDKLELDAGLLPPVVESASIAGRLRPVPAGSLGLPPGIPIIVGGGDAPVAAFAAGISAAAPRGLLTLGTSGQLLLATDRPLLAHHGRLHTLCHVRPEQWCVMAAILSAGASLRWGHRLVGGDSVTLEQLLAEAARVPAGADGVLFTPYLFGERSPHMDPYARAALVGLHGSHHRGHLIRAILEGVAFALRDGLDALTEAGASVEVLSATGRGARSALWCQILASVLARPVEVAADVHGSCYGAALLAGVGAGLIDPQELAPRGPAATRHEPDPALVQRYAADHARYRQAYPATQPLTRPS